MLRRAVRACVLASIGALLAMPAQANLITNGSFESPDVTTGSFGVFFSGVPGWFDFGNGIEIQDHVAGSPCAACGDQFVELDTYSSSGMYQGFGTTANQSYALSFMYSPRPGVSTLDNAINVYWYSSVTFYHLLGTVMGDGSALSDTSWGSQNFSFVADSSLSYVVFLDAGTSNGLGGYLDEVSVSVPEPGTVGLLGVGLLALMGYSVRRARRTA